MDVANERLWAPWRMEYIRAPKTGGCIFCDKPPLRADRDNFIVARGELTFVMLNAYPYTNGHLMVAPYEHIGELDELPPATTMEMMGQAQRGIVALRRAYRPEGFNIGINQGRVAGAGVEHHLHLHVVPRWGADTNFMDVVADTSVLPHALSESHAAIRGEWPEEAHTIDENPGGEADDR